MTIQVKSSEVCKSCIRQHSLPPCGVTTYYKGGSLIDITKGKKYDSFSRPQNYFVCPVDAIKPSNDGVKFINDKCINCGLCMESCPYDNIVMDEPVSLRRLFENLTNNIFQVASFFRSKLDNEYNVFTEVKAIGNSRDKRIDIGIKNTKKLYIIKVLSTLSSIGKYERSYKNMLIDSDDIQMEIEAIFLYCDETNILNTTLQDINNKLVEFTHISLDNVIKHIKGD